MSRLEKFERRIDQKLREVLRSSSPNQGREAIEVYRAILEEVGSRVDTLPRGKLNFGYSLVNVRVLLVEPERRRSYEVVFLEENSLTREIMNQFEERKVEFPGGLKVDVALVEHLPAEVCARGFDVAYSNPAGSALPLNTTPIRLTVLAGNAEKNQYCFAKQRVNIGRLAEVVDSEMRAVRRNDLPLNDDSSLENSTVSRAHAHLECDSDGSRFRLFDDGSAHGTIVVRNGSVVPVPAGTSKGVLLQTGDEIILGKVQIRFEYGEN